MTACDLCGITKPWKIQREVGSHPYSPISTHIVETCAIDGNRSDNRSLSIDLHSIVALIFTNGYTLYMIF